MQSFFSWYFGYRKKTVEYSLKKKEHGVFVGSDNLGKKHQSTELQKATGIYQSLSKSRSVN
jgi:hypothetical protein